METSQSLCFRVCSKYLTEQARDLLIEQGYPAGRRFLTTAFSDMPIELIEQLLKGEKSLHGINEAFVEDQDPNDPHWVEHQQRFKRMYLGVVWWKGDWWEPYATVGAVGGDDLPTKYTRKNEFLQSAPVHGMVTQSRLWHAYRRLHYANDPTTDVVVYFNNEAYLFQRIRGLKQPPPWMYDALTKQPLKDELHLHGVMKDEHSSIFFDSATNRKFQAAIVEIRRSDRFLEPRGYEGGYDSPFRRAVDAAEDVTAAAAKDETVIEESEQRAPGYYKDAFTAMLTETVGTMLGDPEKVAGTIAHYTGKDVVAKPGEVSDSRYGVITPDGVYWPCLYHAHDELIRKIFEVPAYHKPGAKLGETEYAEKTGWIKVHGNIEHQMISFHGKTSRKTEATMREYWAHWVRDQPFPEIYINDN